MTLHPLVGFTTVQPFGQLESPLVIVDSVPRAVGQVNVPTEATLYSQFVVAYSAGFQAVNETSIDVREVQPRNMLL